MIQWIASRLLITVVVSFAFTAGALASVPASMIQPGSIDRRVEIDGRFRTYQMYVPDIPAPVAGFPVLIALHGGGGNAGVMEKKTDFDDLAEQAGFIAVYPDGSGRGEKRLTWDAHNCCGYAYDNQIDDVGFISMLIDQLIADFDVDPARIYVTGHSNGAMMTYRLGCELSDKIAAIAPVAGALNTETCTPSRPLPVLMVHGEDDENVPILGATYSPARTRSQQNRVDWPLSHAVEVWKSADGCASSPTVTRGDGFVHTVYADCADGVELRTVIVEQWGHGWPRIENGAPIDASQLIWDFVSRFSNPAAMA